MSGIRFPPRLVSQMGGVLLAALLLPGGALRAQDAGLNDGNANANASADDASAGTGAESTTDYEEPYSSETTPVEPGVQGLERLARLPPASFGEDPAGIPYSSVLNTTGADVNDINILGGHPVNTDFSNDPKFGGVEGSLLFTPGTPGLQIPFLYHAPPPEDADLKAGPFYVKFHSLDGLVLYDDNYNLSEYDRKSELLVLLRVNLTVIAQLSDNLQFALSGDIGYLPLQNQVGVQGNVYGALGLLAAGPLLAAQVVYDTVIAGFPVRFADDFRAGTGIYSDDERDNFDLFQGDFLQRQNDGRYVFRAGNVDDRNGGFNSTNQDASLIYFSNMISAVTDRLLPGDIRLTVRADHEDLWYNQSNRGLPDSRDDFYAAAVSERENTRFKPYVSYEATYVNNISGVTQIARAGFLGPIDDQLFLRAEAGYFTQPGHQDVLWRVDLDHDAGPYTTEHFSADRDIGYFDDEVRTSYYYRLDQILGPTLVATAFLAYADYRELIDDGEDSRTDEFGGSQLTWYVGPKTTLQVAGIYERQKYSGGLKTDTFTGRIILNRTLTDTLTLQLLYEYQHSVANRPGDSYFDNLVYFRIIKFLD
jgi:hypothetical protein